VGRDDWYEDELAPPELDTSHEEPDLELELQMKRQLVHWFGRLRSRVPPGQWQSSLEIFLRAYVERGLELTSEEVRSLQQWMFRCQEAAIAAGEAGVAGKTYQPPRQARPVLPEHAAFSRFRVANDWLIERQGLIWWESRYRSYPFSFSIGRRDQLEPDLVAVAFLGVSGRVAISRLKQVVNSVNVARRHVLDRQNPAFVVRDSLADLVHQEVREAPRRNAQREEQLRARDDRRIQEEQRLKAASKLLEEHPEILDSTKDTRFDLQPDMSVHELNPDTDPDVRKEMEQHATAGDIHIRDENNAPKKITFQEAQEGTQQEFFRALSIAYDRVVQEETDFVGQLQHLLDWLGLLPFIGDVADVINAGLYTAQGKHFEAALSLMAVVVDAASVARIYRRLAQSLETVERFRVAAKAFRRFADALDNGQALRAAGQELSDAVAAGKITREEAIERLRLINPRLSASQATEHVDAALSIARIAGETGRMAVLRRNMPTRVIRNPDGSECIIFGSAKSSSKTQLHEQAIEQLASEMASTGEFAYITIGDRSWRTATGRLPGASNLRPDVIGLDRSGRFTAYEVASQHDKEQKLYKRLYEGQASIPHEFQGEVRAFIVEKAMTFRQARPKH